MVTEAKYRLKECFALNKEHGYPNEFYINLHKILRNPKSVYIFDSIIYDVNNFLNNNTFWVNDYNTNKACLIKEYWNKYYWLSLAQNPNAVEILESNLHKISWTELCYNNHPRALEILDKHKDFIDWSRLSLGKKVNNTPIIKKNMDKLDNCQLFDVAERSNDVVLLEKNLDKLSWFGLSKNPNAIPILEKKCLRLIGMDYQKIQTQYTY